MTQSTTKKTPMRKTTQKKKKPPSYNYGQMKLDEIKQLGKYFVTELQKIDKAAPGLVPEISNLLNSKQTVVNKQQLPEGLIDLYGGNQPYTTNPNNQVYRQPPTSKPEIVAPPLPYQPYQPGMQGDHMEMPSILGSSGVVVNTLKDDYQSGTPTPFNSMQPQVETAKLPIVEDNSAELGAKLGDLLNG